MGDVVLQSGFCAWLKKNVSSVKITFVTSKEFASLVRDHPFIDHVITHHRAKGKSDFDQLKQIALKIKESKPDLIIDLHNTLRAKVIRLLTLKIPSLVVNKRSFQRWLLVKFKIDRLKHLAPHVERLIKDFQFLCPTRYEKSELIDYLQAQTDLQADALTTIPMSFKKASSSIDGNYIVISPVASFEQKRWPISCYRELLKRLLENKQLSEFRFVIAGGPEDHYCGELNLDPKRVINLQGKSTLDQTNQALQEAKLVVTNDTGVAHMAEALGVRVIALFGPTSPSFGFRMHLKDSSVMYANVKCSPCSNTGAKKCTQKELLCMQGISVDSVEKILLEKLGVSA